MTSGAIIPISSDATIRVNIELLFIGNELLSGTIANTNAQWISSKITQAGGLVKRITTVGIVSVRYRLQQRSPFKEALIGSLYPEDWDPHMMIRPFKASAPPWDGASP